MSTGSTAPLTPEPAASPGSAAERPWWSPRRWWAALVELGSLGPFAAFTVLAPGAGAAVLVSTAGFWFEPLREMGPWALPVYFLASALLAGLSLIPTHASSLLGGLLFGAVGGSAAALGAVLTGAVLGYAVLSRFTRARAALALAKRPRAAAVHRALLHHSGARTVWIITLIRLSPAMPFAATNLLMAASAVRPGAFLLGTFFGIAPRVSLVAVAGASLTELDLTQGADRRLLILGLFATIVALALATRLAARALRQATDPLAPTAPPPSP